MSKLHFILYDLKAKIRKIFTGKDAPDDYDWDFYTDHYYGSLEKSKKYQTQALKPGDYKFEDGKLLKKADIMSLHANAKLLYQTVCQLDPESSFEFGCGAGDHLHNLSVLKSGMKLFGVDVSDRQIALLKKRHSDLNAELAVCDITVPMDGASFETVDLVFTQAVLMHIRREDAYLQGLINIFKKADKYILFMENWAKHDFMTDIKMLADQGKLAWKNIFFHYVYSEELKKPHIMLISKEKLDTYETLDDYELLLSDVAH